jgi:microcystin-dependent protein
VPGGYEGNVQVVKREYKLDMLVENSPLIGFVSELVGESNVYKITCDDSSLAAALSIINPGDVLITSGAANASNNVKNIVISSLYDGTSIIITVSPESALVNELPGASITLIRRFVGSWEILEPEIDYIIDKNGDELYKEIVLKKIPQEEDVIYVVHRGEATYNFVPTEKSVGPAQLSENLRNFKVDIFEGDGSLTDFTITIDDPDEIVNARTLEVSVDGILQYGTDPDLSFTGDFELLSDKRTIRFASAPANGAKIHVRNLGFTTVSRRQTLSPSQIGSVAEGSIGTTELKNGSVTNEKLAINSVSTSNIQPNAVNDSKILMRNNEWLRWSSGLTPNTVVSVLKVDALNLTTLRSPAGTLSLDVAGSRTIHVTQTAILDATASGEVDIGTDANKFKDAHFSGTVNAENIEVAGTVDGVDVSDLQAQVAALAALVSTNTPTGSIKLWAKDTGAPAGWLLCNGQDYFIADYPTLHAEIGRTFTETGLQPDKFRVPDFRGRFPLGKGTGTGTGTGWGIGNTARGGSLDHTHSVPAHTHSLNNHTHSIPAHYHGMGAGADLNIISVFNPLDWPSGTAEIDTRPSRGGHTTSIGHTHTVTGQTGTPIEVINENSKDLNHTHSGTTSIDGSHSHTLPTSKLRESDGGSTPRDRIRVTGRNATEPASTTTINDNDSSHSHNFTTNSTTTPSLSHRHSINLSVNDRQTASSSSDGTHIHSKETFKGRIGLVDEGADGNGSMTSGQAAGNTGDPVYSAGSNTGGANPAYQTINFIIRT